MGKFKSYPARRVVAEKESVEVEGLEEFVVLDHLIEALTAIKTLKYRDLKPTLAQFFIQEAQNDDEFDQSFSAIEGTARASAQLRRRPMRKGLSQADIRILKKNKIPMKTAGVQLVLNPEHNDNTKVFNSLAKLLADNPDSGVPDDFLIKTPSKIVPDDDALVRVLRSESPDIDELLSTIADVIVTKSELDGSDSLRQFARNIEKTIFGNEHNGGPSLY